MRYVIIAPWKISKGTPFEELINNYQKRIVVHSSLLIVTPVQSLNSDVEAAQFLIKEVKKWHADGYSLMALDENGKQFSSEEFAEATQKSVSRGAKGIVFCLGTAFGLPAALKEFSSLELFSLSRMTLPHELALVVAVEQIYRAGCIVAGHPYHHGGRSGLASARLKN